MSVRVEIKIIEFLAERNGYEKKMVTDMLVKIQRGRAVKKEAPKYVSIPFIGNISYKIGRFIEKFDKVRVAYRSENKLANLILKPVM